VRQVILELVIRVRETIKNELSCECIISVKECTSSLKVIRGDVGYPDECEKVRLSKNPIVDTPTVGEAQAVVKATSALHFNESVG
jgi:hypothetical protein